MDNDTNEQELRRLFLRGVWRAIPDASDSSWVDRIAKIPYANKPLGDIGSLARKMLEAGLSADEIARFARIIGYETAGDLLYLIADSHDAQVGLAQPVDVSWGLFVTDPETGQPTDELALLHEDILSADPTGDEMRPPASNQD